VLNFPRHSGESDIRVIENQQVSPAPGVFSDSWADRILILAVVGILFLTLYPFRIDFHTPGGIRYPFLLGKSLKTAGFYDAFLNVLLFTPFGFGVAAKLRERGKSRPFVFLVALIAGACFSYTIEFLQIYIPERDSGWEDVFTNSSGAVVGFLLFDAFGAFLLPVLSRCERALATVLAGWRAALMLLVYFGLWFAASIPLQREARLSDWNTDVLLTIGNDANGKNPWAGQVRLVQIWDRSMSSDEARSMFAAVGANRSAPGSLVSYDFSTSKRLSDTVSLPANLVWIPKPPAHPETSSLVLDGSSWLSSPGAVPQLIQDLQRTNQFAIRIVCAPAKTNGPDARILSISELSGPSNLNVRQEGPALLFWFRNGISTKKSQLSSHVPDVFKSGEIRDILYSYDGSNLFVYVDGKPQSVRYKLGPGATLATLVGHRVKSAELTGYNYIFYALVFFPAGALMGIAARQTALNRIAMYMTFGVVILIVPALFELIGVLISGRSFTAMDLPLSIALVIGGILWINADRHSTRAAP
jgi:glycopeptide antibiotics resistance protein